jgi:RimJ/RimL family protein N-acetyltransferase
VVVKVCRVEPRLPDAETERLWLRRWSAAQHSQALADVNSDPRVMRYLGGVGLSAEESAEAAQRYDAHWETYGFGLWAAMEKSSGHVLGCIGLSHPLWNSELSEEVEVGWRLRRSAWGRGLATEGGAAALRAGFESLGLEEIIAIVDPQNAASMAVTRKLGMTLRESRSHPQTGIPIEVMTKRAPAAD